MRIELDLEESHQLFTAVTDALLKDTKLSKDDSAALKRWRSKAMTPGSEAMKQLAAKINADIARALENKAKSAVIKPDWK
jgi:hypothetical protein